MNLKSFLKLVEIQTKMASVIPFLFGVVYTLYRFPNFNARGVATFFISMLCFDMFTTALNNYQDYRGAIKKEGYNYETHNAIVSHKLSVRSVKAVLTLLLLFAVVFGLFTFLSNDYTVLLLGALSFGVGILYSAGPLPISRTPLGELLSGLFMGGILPFLVIYLSAYESNPLILKLTASSLTVTLAWPVLLPMALSVVPAICCIANIMLANNICDVEDDLPNKRYTLPVQIGRPKALLLFGGLYAAAYLDILLCTVLGYLPLPSLIVLPGAIFVFKNVRTFFRLHTKKDTFSLSILNFLIILLPLILSLIPSILGKYL